MEMCDTGLISEAIMNSLMIVQVKIILTLFSLLRLCENALQFNEAHGMIVNTSASLSQLYGVPCTTILRSDTSSWQEDLEVFLVAASIAKYQHPPQFVHVVSFGHFYGRLQKETCSRTVVMLLGWHTRAQLHFAELSYETPMAGALWVVFLLPNMTTGEYLDSATTPFNAELLTATLHENKTVQLEEAYRVYPSFPLRVSQFGSWNGTHLTAPPELFLYIRRRDLEGFVIRASTKDDIPISVLERNDNGDLQIGGYFGMIYYELARRLNFTSVIIPAVENVTGISKNGTWNGLMGMVQREEIDLAVGPVTFLGSLLPVAGLLWPLLSTNYQIFFKVEGNVMEWNAILKPFGRYVWLCIFLWLLMSTLVMNRLYRLGCLFGSEDELYKPEFTSTNSLLTFFKALCQQGSVLVPSSVPCRILYLTGYLVSLVLLTAYSAALISNLTNQVPYRPFDSLRSFSNDGSYKLIAIGKSTDYAYFSDATDDLRQSIFRRLIKPVPEPELPVGKEQGIAMVCNKFKHALFITFAVTQITARQFSRDGKCEVLHFQTPMDKVFLTIARKKDFPYAEIFNYELQIMANSGILQRLQKLAWGLNRDDKGPRFVQVNIQQIFPIHCILLFGIMVSVAVLLLEIWCHRYRWNLPVPS